MNLKYNYENKYSYQIDGLSMRVGATPCKVSVCRPKTQLFVGNIPKSKDKDELFEEFKKRTSKYQYKKILRALLLNVLK